LAAAPDHETGTWRGQVGNEATLGIEHLPARGSDRLSVGAVLLAPAVAPAACAEGS
jgi:hypothetical protein